MLTPIGNKKHLLSVCALEANCWALLVTNAVILVTILTIQTQFLKVQQYNRYSNCCVVRTLTSVES